MVIKVTQPNEIQKHKPLIEFICTCGSGLPIDVVFKGDYQSLQQKVSELEAEIKESRKQLDDNARISADNLLAVYDKYEETKAENERLRGALLKIENRLLVLGFQGKMDIPDIVRQALKGEEK